MKVPFIVTALVALSTSVSAADLPVPGLELNTEVKAFRTIDAEKNNVTVEPELRYSPDFLLGGLSFTTSSLLTVYETDHASGDDIAIQNIWEDGHKPTIDFGVEYQFMQNATAYAESGWDFNTEGRTDIEVGVSFNF